MSEFIYFRRKQNFMKIIFYLFVFVYISFSKVNASTLVIHLSQCRSECETEAGLIKVYKGRKLIHKSRSLKTELKNLKAGTYYVRYNTIAEKKRELEVVIIDNQDRQLTLCFDDFEYYKKQAPSAIDVLKDNEKIAIYYEGKFKRQKEKDSISFVRRGAEYYMEYKNIERKMTEVEKEIIREFEYFLMYFSRKGFGKKKGKYIFKYNDIVVKRKDKTSKWNGFHYLLVDFGLLETDAC